MNDKIIDGIKDKKLINDLEERKELLKGNMKEEQFNRLFSK